MAFDFPNSPTEGQTFTPSGGPTYIYHAPAWELTTGTGGASIIISTTPPVGASDGTLWWESDSGLLYLRFNDGTSTQWVIACPQPDVSASATVRYDIAQTLTQLQQQQARQNIYATPFDALAYSGIQVNGAMEIDQLFGGSANPGYVGGIAYMIDQWAIQTYGSQILTSQQQQTGPPGIPNCLALNVTTANAAPAATDFCMISQSIEGYRCRRLAWGSANAKPLTVGFWVFANRPGNYSCVVASTTRACPVSFTVVANTWEYKTVTFPGDTAGTWPIDNSASVRLGFTIMAGSGRQGTAGVWSVPAPNQITGVTGMTNGVAATSDAFAITGVTVLPGTEAPSAERSPYIMRPFDEEFILCMRYYEVCHGSIRAWTNGYIGHHIDFRATKRAVPTMTAHNAGSPTTNPGFEAFYYVGTDGAACQWTQAGDVMLYGAKFSADARM